jgi:hypothetical protein
MIGSSFLDNAADLVEPYLVGARVAEEQVEAFVAEHGGSIAAPPRGVKPPPVNRLRPTSIP